MMRRSAARYSGRTAIISFSLTSSTVVPINKLRLQDFSDELGKNFELVPKLRRLKSAIGTTKPILRFRLSTFYSYLNSNVYIFFKWDANSIPTSYSWIRMSFFIINIFFSSNYKVKGFNFMRQCMYSNSQFII